MPSDTYGGYSPRILPFTTDQSYGFSQNVTINQVALQNLMNVILTVPGERIMDPGFGVGLRNYLFEQNLSITRNNLASAIRTQVAKYLPYITIEELSFDNSDADANLLNLGLSFSISHTGELIRMQMVADRYGVLKSVYCDEISEFGPGAAVEFEASDPIMQEAYCHLTKNCDADPANDTYLDDADGPCRNITSEEFDDMFDL